MTYTQPTDDISMPVTPPLRKWFNDHLIEFQHIFAIVDLSLTESTVSGFEWLKPTYVEYAYIHVPISPGIDGYAETTHFAQINLTSESDGTKTLTFDKAEDAKSHTWHTVATWVTVTEAIADIIIAAIGTAASRVAVAIERVLLRWLVVLLIGGVAAGIAGILEKIPEWTASDASDALPATDPLVNSADFQITSAQLNGGMQLGGNPFPA
ncbi:hypothetical protein CP973_15840 [Streptomyces albofaciens JCM 4342]|uniref:TULIP family P47-like protein n=1 Tax=Streptomyces albofaciens TaxID=66866 RepID=UPI000AD40073|nr:TULIP family P47-like protein [Streptomyces albofaciens]KAA6223190.1 hypothetical protein CP973_15840 [Streptomyces albofaciens JCM 4342]